METTTMTIKLCSDSEKNKKSNTTYFYVWMRWGQLKMFKLDRSQHFSSSSDLNYSARHFTTFAQLPPTMFKPYFSSHGFLRHAATAALGSKIYIIGGSATGEEDTDDDLPRAAYSIDTATDPPAVVALPPLRWGKGSPIAFAVNGMIYVMPHSFSRFNASKPAPGKYFERYDPDHNSWTVLPRPPPREAPDGGWRSLRPESDPLLVRSHAVVGSTILVSIGTDSVYSFDTVELWWIEITLDLETGVMLHSLPFQNPFCSPVGSSGEQKARLVLCSPDTSTGRRNKIPDKLREFLSRDYKIDPKRDYYVCRFEGFGLDDIVSSGGVVKVSITPFDGSSMELRWEEFVRHQSCFTQVSGGIGDGLVLVTKVGHDCEDLSRGCDDSPDYYDYGYNVRRHFEALVGEGEEEVEPELYYTFELFRVGTFGASSIASSLFIVPSVQFEPNLFHNFDSFRRCFAMEDGIFIN